MLYLPYCGRSSVFLWPSQVLSLAKFTFSDLGIWLSHQNKFIFDGFQIGNGPEQWLVQKNNKISNYFHVLITGTKPNSCYFASFSCQSNEPVGFLPGLFSNSSKGFSSRRRDVSVKFWSIKFNNNNNNKISVRCQEKVAAICVFEEVHHLTDYLRVDQKCS